MVVLLTRDNKGVGGSRDLTSVAQILKKRGGEEWAKGVREVYRFV